MSFIDRHQPPCFRHRHADEEDGGGDPACAALAAAAAGGLAKLLVAGAADPESGLERGDMLKVRSANRMDVHLIYSYIFSLFKCA